MKIAENKVVVLNYAVSDSEGTLIDSSYDHEPLAIIHGTGYLIPGLESALVGHEVGDTFEVEVAADDAYGQRIDGFVQTVPKEMFDNVGDLNVGTQLRATTDEGEQTVIVIDVTDETITVDGNHPLAGIDLSFDVEIMEVRDATEEELAHGHVHQEKSGCCGGGSCSSEKSEAEKAEGEGGCCSH